MSQVHNINLSSCLELKKIQSSVRFFTDKKEISNRNRHSLNYSTKRLMMASYRNFDVLLGLQASKYDEITSQFYARPLRSGIYFHRAILPIQIRTETHTCIHVNVSVHVCTCACAYVFLRVRMCVCNYRIDYPCNIKRMQVILVINNRNLHANFLSRIHRVIDSQD